MKTFCEQMLSHITTVRIRPISSKLERTSRRTIVKQGPFLALFTSSLLCACTGIPYGNAPVTELNPQQLFEQRSVRAAETTRSVLPGNDARTERIAVPAAPEQARTIALAPRRGAGLSGDWHGVLSQESSASDGSMVSLGRLFRVSLQQAGDTVTGSGEMSSGERLKISGTVEQGHSHGIVENITYGIASRFVGTVTDQEIVVHFINGGREEGVQGVATLHRREN
ncbi:MAG: hypothetical protein E8D40_07960 [Nitrospira sp.]|nr:MAG: hypothetical protein E8D40_07960 [Nitrospira sp.]